MSDRCSACPGKYKCIKGTGPMPPPIGTWIGEAPGWEEERKGEPFVGKTGREVNEGYFPLAGLQRPKARVLNAIRCLPDTVKHKLDMGKQAHKDLLLSCAEYHLYPELEESKPPLIVPMGAFACYAIDPDINLELQHGIPIQTYWGPTFPMYHPAGGIHEPKKMLQIRTDWYRLRKYLRNDYTLPTDQYPNPDYQEIETPEQLDVYMAQHRGIMAGDTEITRKREPYCLTISVLAGTGRLIRAVNQAVLNRFQDWLDMWDGEILFHNWLFDAEVVEAMGLKFPWRRMVDTMIKVFHLGNLPQGLKALAYRELGMVMQDFDDLVTPYSRPIVLDYYARCNYEEWSVPEKDLVRDSNGGWKLYKPQGFGTKLKRFWGDHIKGKDRDVFEMWTNNWEEHQAEVEGVMGPWPGKCITHAPFEKVLFYACRDADATIRLYPVIQHMESRTGKYAQEVWREGYAATT